jgi:signal transduction histidine kinase
MAWTGILFFVSALEFHRQKIFFGQIFSQLDDLEELEEAYLIAELLPYSPSSTDELYREILRRCGKSMIEKIRCIEEERLNYREFIEAWVHEIKTPITTMMMLIENEKRKGDRNLLAQLSTIDNKVEMALYYARSEGIYRDFILKPIHLQEEIHAVLQKYKQIFLIHHAAITIEVTPDMVVIADTKWLRFVLAQILLNAVKYRKPGGVQIQIFTEEDRRQKLLIRDNGIGILPHDLERIFEKGFTGSNGRSQEQKATGMGLYLCQKLCEGMDLVIDAQSEWGVYTQIGITFSHSDFFAR